MVDERCRIFMSKSAWYESVLLDDSPFGEGISLSIDAHTPLFLAMDDCVGVA